MHINHTHPEFDLHFMDNLSSVQKMFENHPVLSMKKNILDTLQPQQVMQLQNQITQLSSLIIEQEKPLLSQLALQKPQLIHSQDERTLHTEEKEFVQKHAFSVRQHFGPMFSQLEEYAIISDTQEYQSAYQEYQQFQQAVDALNHKKQLHQVLETQLFLTQKIGFRLQTDASFIHSDVTRLQSTLLDQQTILARLPSFKLK